MIEVSKMPCVVNERVWVGFEGIQARCERLSERSAYARGWREASEFRRRNSYARFGTKHFWRVVVGTTYCARNDVQPEAGLGVLSYHLVG